MFEDTIWVGQNSIGTMWLYDPDMPHDNPRMIYLYSLKENKLIEKPKNQARNVLSSTAKQKADVAISRYLEWKKLWGGSAVKVLKEVKEREREKAAQKLHADTIERHRAYLKKIGKYYSGAKQSNQRKHRSPSCWKCHERLDPSWHTLCGTCGWFICRCGTCGCGYKWQAAEAEYKQLEKHARLVSTRANFSPDQK